MKSDCHFFIGKGTRVAINDCEVPSYKEYVELMELCRQKYFEAAAFPSAVSSSERSTSTRKLHFYKFNTTVIGENGMGTRSLVAKAITTHSTPIGVKEFLTALSNIISTSNHGSCNRRLGLAISGGVDSMALASLCSRILHSPGITDFSNSGRESENLETYSFQAFVVDHGFRHGSDAEANSVSNILIERGIPTKILKIQWHGDRVPTKSPNFESLARRHRFQILGQACRESQIDSLLLAHHQDDQAETVLMRMLNGHRMPGLMGIQGDSEIPECYGIHGVHMSGGIDDSIHSQRRQERLPYKPTAIRHYQPPNQLLVETGGIRVYRPLLKFTKARLQATCMADKLGWFEDLTNKNPTITMRNAVRYMYENHSLPAALSKSALLAISQRFKDTAAADLLVMNSWLASCPISYFENRTGALTICFKDLRDSDGPSALDERRRHIAAKLLQQVISLVTPYEHVHISSVHGVVERIFPELWPINEFDSLQPQRFTVAGVIFSPLSYPQPTGLAASATLQTSHNKCEWRISRQPYASRHIKTPSFLIPALTDWSPWTLFDGRYWISIKNRNTYKLLIRPFRKEDYTTLLANFGKEDRRLIRKNLKQIAPGDEKWTLPAIIGEDIDGKENVLALPTLDIRVPQTEGQVGWRVRYKKIKLEGLKFSLGNICT